jgi:cardiolipin synthase
VQVKVTTKKGGGKNSSSFHTIGDKKMKKILFVILATIFILIGWIRLDIDAGSKEVQKVRQSTIHYGDFQLYTDGHDLYKALFSDIRKANSYIYIHFYIIENDQISRNFLSLLKEKAKQGVEVKLSADRIGSHKLTKSMIESLRKAGVEFTFSGKAKWHHVFYTIQNRNHRRIIVIDGNTVYIGGFNMGKEHLGKDKKIGHWRDYHVRISGDGAQDIERQFLDDWKKDTGKMVTVHNTVSSKKGSTRYKYVFSDGKGLAELYKEMFKMSRKSLVIATPYFIPGKDMTKELLKLRKRGVSLKILVPIESDALFMKQASYPYLRELLKHGAEIYLYQHGFFHGKVMVIDEKLVDLGTANIDTRSFYLNDESNCFIYEGPILADIKERLDEDFRHSKRLTESHFKKMNLWDLFLEQASSVISYYL